MDGDSRQGHGLGAFVREHSASLATGMYVLLTAIGMNYTYWYYRLLGVPILDYAQPGDFLLAGVHYPLLLLFSIASVMFISWLMSVDRQARARSISYARRAERMEKSPFYNEAVVRTLIIIAYFSIFSYYYAAYSARQIVNGNGNSVDVVTSDPEKGPTLGETTLIGSTSSYLFVYDKKGAQVDAIPVESVVRLEFKALKKK